MCVVFFCTAFALNVSHSQKNWARYDKNCNLAFKYSTRYSCPILMKLEFSRPSFEKYSNIKFHFKNFVLWKPSCSMCTQGRKDRHTNFFLSNQPDALIIPILFCYKTLHVSDIFSAHHQEFSTVGSALVSFMQVLVTASKQSQDVPFWLCLEAVIRNLHETYQCRMYSRKLLMMGKEDARNM